MRVFKKLLKIGGIILLAVFVLVLIAAFYLYNRVQDWVYPEYAGNTPSVLQYYDEPAPESPPPGVDLDLSDATFDPARFQEPDPGFGPWTRWW